MRLVDLGLRLGLGSLAFAAASCSDPVAPTARGGWTVAFTDPGVECNVRTHSSQVGDINKNVKAVDGEGGATITCSVDGSGSFNVDAEARQSPPLRSLHILIPSISPGATKDNPATGTVSFADSDTQNAY